MIIRAGDLDRSIVIMRATPTIGASRVVAQTWAPLVNARAKLVTINTTDILRSGGSLGDAVCLFQTRWLDGILLTDQISYPATGVQYAIKSIVEIGRRIGLEFRCEAIQ